MLRALFTKRNIPCHDADGSCKFAIGPHKRILIEQINNGLSLYPIQIPHYASVHYVGRWGTLSGRFCNAFLNIAASFDAPPDSQYLTLKNEYHELKTNSSEIIGVGLATISMCRIFNARLPEVSRIDGSGKRCDYRISKNREIIIYEARGREHKSDFTKAAKEIPAKKQAHVADYKYGIISSLPRDGMPVQIYFYDPPGDEHVNPPSHFEMLINTAKYYEKASRLSGYFILADKINSRINKCLAQGDWIEGELEIPENVIKMGDEYRIQNLSFWSAMQPAIAPSRDYKIGLRFGLHNRVRNYLIRWQINSLLEYTCPEIIDYEKKISIAQDGTLLKITSVA
ncbi:hypothetical protein Psch_02635 [Pelotomaculum schinkii]|uniref:Uncharacterized protein n=1 Tax=Pelotomaculum schinkii TaxID=78350 RepID=A0A4Y7R9H2_9FIRM|nr:hypothetical protein [Pelotomaculum schinkii]TEB05594.1 hypothetical protein Psch_02635 [Pelotomaculum schinkii]